MKECRKSDTFRIVQKLLTAAPGRAMDNTTCCHFIGNICQKMAISLLTAAPGRAMDNTTFCHFIENICQIMTISLLMHCDGMRDCNFAEEKDWFHVSYLCFWCWDHQIPLLSPTFECWDRKGGGGGTSIRAGASKQTNMVYSLLSQDSISITCVLTTWQICHRWVPLYVVLISMSSKQHGCAVIF